MEHRSLSPQTLAAQAIGETDPATGLSGVPIHEPVHARGPRARHPATVRNVISEPSLGSADGPLSIPFSSIGLACGIAPSC
jgi:hypothetical protein